MDSNVNFLFYSKGKVDKRLKTGTEYKFSVFDVQYSEITKTVQFMFTVELPWSKQVLYFLQEYHPMSKKFKRFLEKACYCRKKELTKKVQISDLKHIEFTAQLHYEAKELCIDLETVKASFSLCNPLHPLYDKIVIIDDYES